MNTAATPTAFNNGAAHQQEQASKAFSADQSMRRAVARIEASRSALIVCLAPDPPAGRSDSAGRFNDGGAYQSFAETLATRIERNGLVLGSWRTVRTLTRRWWSRQPWHASVDLLGQTLAHQARPLMRRHPLATLAVGAAVGAGLVTVASAVRPWAWQSIRQQANPWRDRLGGLLWTQLTSAPLQMALFGALATLLADQGGRNDPPRERSAEAAQPQAQAHQAPGTQTPDTA